MASSAGATKGSSPLVSIRDGASAERPLAEALADTATVPKKEGVFPTLRKTERFSAYHPMIPKRYIPAWQVDMKNRKLIIKNCQAAENQSWVGHVSYFWEGRERLSATKTSVYSSVIGYTRSFHRNSSPFSRYNSALVTMNS